MIIKLDKEGECNETWIKKTKYKKSIAARTTGKAKRNFKKALCPSYGTKGMGIFHPVRSSYNKLYKQTTFGINDIKSTNKGRYEYSTKKQAKSIQHNFQINGFTIVIAIICAIGIYGIISFFNLCFGPCNHDWKYISYKHDYQCSKCHEWKKQVECNHTWVVTENSANWYQKNA